MAWPCKPKQRKRNRSRAVTANSKTTTRCVVMQQMRSEDVTRQPEAHNVVLTKLKHRKANHTKTQSNGRRSVAQQQKVKHKVKSAEHLLQTQEKATSRKPRVTE